jgi:hypothetical protein
VERIVIEGNAVSHVTESIRAVSSLETFIEELIKTQPMAFNILPINCVAVESNNNIRTYHIYLDHGIFKLTNSQTQIKEAIFLPPSLFQISVGAQQNVTDTSWHFVEELPKDNIFNTRVYKNILPNVDGYNHVCFGESGFTINPTSNIQAVIDATLDAILSSNFNADYLAEKIDPRIVEDIHSWGEGARKERLSKQYGSLSENIRELDSADWSTFTPKEKAERVKLIQNLQIQRTILQRQYSQDSDWTKDFLGYLGNWTNERLDDIAKTPKKIIQEFLTTLCIKHGYSMQGSGEITYDGRGTDAPQF